MEPAFTADALGGGAMAVVTLLVLSLALAVAYVDRRFSAHQLALAATTRHFHAVFANAPVVLFAFDAAGTITMARGRDASGMHRYSDEVVGRSFFAVNADVPELLQRARRALAGQEFTADVDVDPPHRLSVRRARGYGPLGVGRVPAMREADIRVGTAAWAIPRDVRERFDGDGSRLERYARRFACVEINSSFYRPHRPATYARWAASVPDDFRFALKVPKEITHTRRFVDVVEPLERFLAESAELGEKRGVLLVQLPPSFAYEAELVDGFFTTVRARYDGLLACEPRHPTWFAADAEESLRRARAARVAADPAVVPDAAVPGGWDGFVYYRLHGFPRTYYSAYDDAALRATAARLRAADVPAWCIFDNTALDAATANALDLTELLRGAV